MTAWDRVFHLLKAALPAANYHRGKELRRSRRARRASGAFRRRLGGRRRPAGRRRRHPLDRAAAISPRRSRRSMPATRPGAGWCRSRRFRPRCTAQLFEDFAFCLPANEQMLGYPVAGPDNDLRPGHRRYNFVWYRPASEERRTAAAADRRERPHPRALDPAAADRARRRGARCAQAASEVLAPQFNAMLSLCAQPFLQPIYDLEVPRMAFGRVAILGDAAFVARPHVGAGVAKAAEDALALADALAGMTDVEAALRHFEAARLGVGEKIIARARHLGAYVQADLKTRGGAHLRGAAPEARGGAGRDRADGFLKRMRFPFGDATRQLIASRCAAFKRVAGDGAHTLKHAAVAITLADADGRLGRDRADPHRARRRPALARRPMGAAGRAHRCGRDAGRRRAARTCRGDRARACAAATSSARSTTIRRARAI